MSTSEAKSGLSRTGLAEPTSYGDVGDRQGRPSRPSTATRSRRRVVPALSNLEIGPNGPVGWKCYGASRVFPETALAEFTAVAERHRSVASLGSQTLCITARHSNTPEQSRAPVFGLMSARGILHGSPRVAVGAIRGWRPGRRLNRFALASIRRNADEGAHESRIGETIAVLRRNRQ